MLVAQLSISTEVMATMTAMGAATLGAAILLAPRGRRRRLIRLVGRVAIPIMVGAAPIHTLAVDAYLRPLLIEIGASCPTRGLFVLESQLSELEAVVGFVNRAPAAEGQPVATRAGAIGKATVPRKPYEMTVNDRRFLRSLRIAAEEAKVEETN